MSNSIEPDKENYFSTYAKYTLLRMKAIRYLNSWK